MFHRSTPVYITGNSVGSDTVECCADQIYLVLPEEAKKYYVFAQKKLSLEQIINKRSTHKALYISVNALLRLYPLFRLRYVTANEIVPIVRHGIYELYKV
jgi:hypothetical protein